MPSTTSTETSTKIPSITPSQEGFHFHAHFNRNQFEKLINLKLRDLNCHDIKCKNEKNYMKKAITHLSQTFTAIFNLYEKQRKDMIIIYNLYSKLCDEFCLPYRLERPAEHDFRRLEKIAEMIKGYLPKKNDVNGEFLYNSKESEFMFVNSENTNAVKLNNLSKSTMIVGMNGGPATLHVENNNIQNNKTFYNNKIKTNEFIENNRKRRISGCTSFLNVSPSINGSASLSVQPPSTSANMNVFLNENFGSSPIVAVNLNCPRVNLNNLNQIKQPIINCNNINDYKNNTQIVIGNTQMNNFSQQSVIPRPLLPVNERFKKIAPKNHFPQKSIIPRPLFSVNEGFKKIEPKNHPHNLRSKGIEKLNPTEFTAPTASALVVSGQELLLHELLGVSEKRAKFTTRKADEIEVIEID